MALSPNNEQDNGDNSFSNQGSGTGHNKKVKAGIFSADALEISGGLIFLVIGGGFHIAGGWLHIAGFICDFLVVCCGLTIITHHVETFKLFGFHYWLSLGVTFIIFASLAFYVVGKEKTELTPTNAIEPKPEFVFGIQTSHDQRFFAFTNSELKAAPNKPYPILVIPTFTNESDIRLVFSIQNRSKIPIENLEFLIKLPKDALFKADNLWEPRFPDSTNEVAYFFTQIQKHCLRAILRQRHCS